MARNILRVGVDSAGGLITGIISTKTTVSGFPIVCVGAAVAPHGVGPHGGATMATGSARTSANGSPVCGAGDTATCGHVGTGGDPNATVT